MYSEHEIYTTDIDGTQNVINAAKKSGLKNRAYIHNSQSMEYLINTQFMKVIAEGVGAYGKAKIEQKKICAGSRDEKYDDPILRPKSL